MKTLTLEEAYFFQESSSHLSDLTEDDDKKFVTVWSCTSNKCAGRRYSGVYKARDVDRHCPDCRNALSTKLLSIAQAEKFRQGIKLSKGNPANGKTK